MDDPYQENSASKTPVPIGKNTFSNCGERGRWKMVFFPSFDFIGSSSPAMKNFAATALVRIRIKASAQFQSWKKVFFQKMKNEITLKGDTLSQLDFNLTPQDIVLNCSDGQVR